MSELVERFVDRAFSISTPIEDGFHERMGTPILESDRKYRMWGRDIDDDEHIANLELTATLRNNLPTIIAALKAAEWRPISEAKRDTLYQLFEPHDWGGFQFVGCTNTDGAWINNLDFCIQHPTHFKPLGPRPEGEG